MISALLFTCSALLAFCTLLPLSANEKWWIRGWDFPRLQLLFFGWALVLNELLFFDFNHPASWAALSVSAACTVYQSWWILPYTKVWPHQVLNSEKKDPLNTISILVANVLQTNHCYEDLLKMIREKNPHIFVTLETNRKWQEHLDKLEVQYPYSVKCPLENLYGMHVYSKLPLTNSEIKFLILEDIPSIHTEVALPSGVKVDMHFMHPIPPRPSDTGESTERDAELVYLGKNLIKKGRPVIVSGDLNDVAWSRTTKLFLKISRLLDPRIGRGMFNTFHAGHWFVRWPLDHLFHSRHFTLSHIERLPKFGSDHFPVLVELIYDEEKSRYQKSPLPNEDDQEMADDKLDF